MVGVHMAVPAVPGRVNAVEEVHAAVHRLQDIGGSSHPHKVHRLFLRQMGHGHVQHVVHFLVALAHRQAAHRVAVQVHFPDHVRVPGADAVHHAALVYAKEQLFPVDGVRQSVEPVHLLLAACKPPGGPLHGIADVLLVRMAGRAFVKGHGDGGTQVGLDLHALLRPHKNLAAVDVGVKIDPFLLDLSQTGQGKHLKAAGVRQDRPVPVHEPVQAAELPDQLVAGAHMQMVGVGELHLGADLAQVVGGNRALDGAHRAHVHEHRGLDGAVDGLHLRPLGPAVLCYHFIFHRSHASSSARAALIIMAHSIRFFCISQPIS